MYGIMMKIPTSFFHQKTLGFQSVITVQSNKLARPIWHYIGSNKNRLKVSSKEKKVKSSRTSLQMDSIGAKFCTPKKSENNCEALRNVPLNQ